VGDVVVTVDVDGDALFGVDVSPDGVDDWAFAKDSRLLALIDRGG
jgi:hypothetical protein